jgi:hypothetical protein
MVKIAVDFPHFQEGAACAGIDGEMFFEAEQTRAYVELKLVKQICKSCPSQFECLEYALKHNVVGVWGGTTHNERRAIRQRRGIVVIPLITGAD